MSNQTNKKLVIDLGFTMDFGNVNIDPQVIKDLVKKCFEEGRDVLERIASQPGDFIKDAPEQEIVENAKLLESLRAVHVVVSDSYIDKVP